MAIYETYSEMVSTAGSILAHQKDHDFSGNEYFVVYNEERGEYGFALVAFGSCTACDALQGCIDDDTYEYDDDALQSLCDGIVGSIHWSDTLAELLAWVESAKADGTHLLHYCSDYEYDEERSGFPAIHKDLVDLVQRHEP